VAMATPYSPQEMAIKDTNKLWFIGERSIIHGVGWQLT